MTSQRLVFHGRQQVALETFDLSEISVGEVRIRTALSLMSTGTENIVFNRQFDPGTHWDRWVKYPFFPGYASVGVVEESEKSCDFLQGQRVAFRQGHRSHAVVRAEDCFPIPDELSWEEAVWFALAKIAFHGAHAADYRLGDHVLILGAGPIGQMSLRWARAAGARVIVADPIPLRLEMVRTAGAACLLEATKIEGPLPRVVIDSTGHAKVFQTALGLAADAGTVVILGDTGHPAEQCLTSDVITRGICIKGAHDGHRLPGWDNAGIIRHFFGLVQDGRFPLDGLITHRFAPSDCASAYETANRDRAQTMGIVFDWIS